MSLEDFNKKLHDIAEAQKSAQADGKPRHQQTDKMVAEIKGDIAALKASNADATRYVADGSAGDVDRTYMVTDAADLKTFGVRKSGRLEFNRKTCLSSDAGVVKMLGGYDDVGNYVPGYLDDEKPKSDHQHEAQKLATLLSFVKSVKGGHAPKATRMFERHMRTAPGVVGKVFADNAGEGSEWIPSTTLMPELLRELELDRGLEAIFSTFDIGAGNTVFPFLSQGLRPYKYTQPASGDMDPGAFTGSVPTTADRTITPANMAVYLPVDRDAEEDSVIAFAQEGFRMLREAHRDGTEDCIINGDTTASHYHTGITGWDTRGRWGTAGLGGTTDHRRLWTGLMARADDVSTTVDQGATQTVAGFAALRAQLNGANMLDVVAITSLEYLLVKLLVDSNVMTVDKYGSMATLVTGEIAKLFGIPIVVSDFVDVEYNASGVYDDSTKTKTALLMVNASRFKMGHRRGLRLERDVSIRHNRVDYVSSERKTFWTPDSATEKNCALGYNLSPS